MHGGHPRRAGRLATLTAAARLAGGEGIGATVRRQQLGRPTTVAGVGCGCSSKCILQATG